MKISWSVLKSVSGDCKSRHFMAKPTSVGCFSIGAGRSFDFVQGVFRRAWARFPPISVQ
jgi:hypothetical protein